MSAVEKVPGSSARLRLRAIVDDCYSDLLRFFKFRGFSGEDARDLVQQTLLEALRSSASYRRESGLGGWVLGIAKNVYRGQLRSRGRDKRAGVEVPLEVWMTQEPRADSAEAIPPQALSQSLAAERSRLLRTALGELTEEQRSCLILRIDQDLSYREIADVLQISIDAVKVRLHAAKKKLRERLGEYFEMDLH